METPLEQNLTLTKKEEKLLKRYFRIMFKCDNVRFISPLKNKIFLVLGKKRNTKEDKGTWINQDGEIQNWDYLVETTVASGHNIPELITNAKKYKSLEGKRAMDLLLEEIERLR